LFFFLTTSVQKAFCQEELLDEDAQTTISKQQQKKITKEAAKANKGGKASTKKGTKVEPVKPATDAVDEEETADVPKASDTKSSTTKTAKDSATPPPTPTSKQPKSIDNFDDEEDKQPVAKPNVVNGERVYIVPNKSTNPPTTEVMDSFKQGELNLYRPLVDTQWVAQKNMRQAREYKEGLDPYSAKPKNMFEICLNIGVPTIGGDIQSDFKLGKTHALGFTVRKSIGYVTSLRFQYNQGTAYGAGWKGVENYFKNKGVNGKNDSTVNYLTPSGGGNGTIFLNYQTKYKAMYGQLVINLNNIKFHKERTKVIFYAVLGGGPLFYSVKIDQLTNGKLYNYAGVSNSVDFTNNKERKTELKKIWDGDYESYAEQDVTFAHSKKAIRSGLYKWRIDMTACAGLGVSFRLSRKFTLNFESLQTFTFDDLIDGQRWQEAPYGQPVMTSSNDVLNFTSASINYNIGSKSAEPLWWLNPIDNQLVGLSEAKNKLAKIPEFTDGDNDGVIDFLDREPNTPEGCQVDTHGVQLDSDKDGIPDCRDKEPFSVPGAKVDIDGIAEKKTNPEIDTLMARVKDMLANGGGANATFPGWYLPMIHFDLDKDYIKPDFYPDMFHLAQVMKMYPQMKVYIDGHTDIRHSNTYNEELSHRRAENAKNFLIKNYGLDPERLIVRFLGKSTNMVKDLPDHYDPRFEREQYINRRVEFTVVPESMSPQSAQDVK
jgi:flagellar motor protein MotB